MKPKTSWILVADGARARVLSRSVPSEGLKLEHEAEQPAQPTRDINADRPGRTFDSAGVGRHAMEPHSDPARERKRTFARDLVQFVEAGRKRNAFDRLYLVAPPQTLGDLRRELGTELAAAVTGELPKDLTHVPLHELEAALGDLLAP